MTANCGVVVSGNRRQKGREIGGSSGGLARFPTARPRDVRLSYPLPHVQVPRGLLRTSRPPSPHLNLFLASRETTFQLTEANY